MGRAGPDPGVLVPEIAEGSLGFGVLWVEGREPGDRGGAFEGVAQRERRGFRARVTTRFRAGLEDSWRAAGRRVCSVGEGTQCSGIVVGAT